MGQISKFKKMYPVIKPSRYSENILTYVRISGVLVPWEKAFRRFKESDYKLIAASGLEYFIISDSEWEKTLPLYSWEEVEVVGLLNVSNMTLIPQKISPKGPTGEKESVIDIAIWKSREMFKKIINNIVPTPAIA